jgi:nucleoside-triphosphatase THEP1
MVIVITGDVGVGKTTVCRKLIAIAKNRGYTCGGILTDKAPDKGIIIEDIGSGKTERLASVEDIYDGPRTPKYHFNPNGIEFGTRAIESAGSATILVVDEIGYLELGGEGFTRVLELIEAGGVRNCVIVIRSELLAAFMVWLPTALVFNATIDNREQLPDEIGLVLLKGLEGSKVAGVGG